MKRFIYDEKNKKIGEIIMYDDPIELLTKTKIALVIGHDIDVQGAYGSEGISEFQFNDELLAELSFDDMLPDHCEYGVFYRNAEISSYTKQMIDLHDGIDKWGADLSIEFHFNSFSSDKAQGHEVLYCSTKGKMYANNLNIILDKYLPTSNRGIKKVQLNPGNFPDDRGAGFCCRGKSAAIIIEPFFGAHQHKFKADGSLREPLKNAIKEFLMGIG